MSIEELYDKFNNSSGITTDSRKITKDCMFFSLRGSNFNGNEFAESAAKKGAMYVIIDEKKYLSNNDKYILVNDSLEALQNLANFHRKKLNTKIIGITGSNGKTTTKELISCVLKTKFNCYSTKGNLNNHIGVPLSILEISNKTEIAVIEMGANNLGEIKLLSKIAEPNYGLITNFGMAHIEGFGSEENVIKGKCELYNFLSKKSRLIFFNTDDEKQKRILSNYKNKFGFGKKGSDLNYSVKTDHPNIEINVNGNIIQSTLFGNYNVQNIISAVSVGHYFGVEFNNIKKAISNYTSVNNRSQILIKNNNKIILDAYNANPTSMLLAIKSFEKSGLKNKTIILGDMYELGENKNKFHQEIIDYCERLDVNKIFLVGEIFSKTKYSKKFISVKNYIELSELKEFTKINNSNYLIKGSRAMQLEKIVKYI